MICVSILKLVPLSSKDTNYNNIKQNTCDICERRVVKASHLKHHKQVKHEGIPYKCVPCSPGNMFECDICSQRFSSNHNMKEHQSSKYEGTKYQCDSCDYQTGYLIDISKHCPACLAQYK